MYITPTVSTFRSVANYTFRGVLQILKNYNPRIIEIMQFIVSLLNNSYIVFKKA